MDRAMQNERSRLKARMRLLSPQERAVFYEAEDAAGSENGHEGTPKSSSMSDQHLCACGWKSEPYNDGREYAREDWVRHLLDEGIQIKYPVAA